MIASKFLDDFYYSNKHWGEIGGIETAEINYLELEFLFRITFTCTISEHQTDPKPKTSRGQIFLLRMGWPCGAINLYGPRATETNSFLLALLAHILLGHSAVSSLSTTTILAIVSLV